MNVLTETPPVVSLFVQAGNTFS